MIAKWSHHPERQEDARSRNPCLIMATALPDRRVRLARCGKPGEKRRFIHCGSQHAIAQRLDLSAGTTAWISGSFSFYSHVSYRFAIGAPTAAGGTVSAETSPSTTLDEASNLPDGTRARRQIMRTISILFACALTSSLLAGPAFSAVKFKRFPHCPEGLVTKRTCECHAGASGRYRFCHAGDYCDTARGHCDK